MHDILILVISVLIFGSAFPSYHLPKPVGLVKATLGEVTCGYTYLTVARDIVCLEDSPFTF